MRILFASLLAAWTTAAAAMECRDDPAVMEQCFELRGRVSIGVGGEILVWPSGTKRLLQLSYPDQLPQSLTAWPYIPPRLEKLMRAGEADVWGDFEVCPLTADIPGQRRLICIQSFRNVGVVENPRYKELAREKDFPPAGQ